MDGKIRFPINIEGLAEIGEGGKKCSKAVAIVMSGLEKETDLCQKCQL